MNSYNMHQYQESQISTASPEQILLMLYDGAIRFTRQAMYGLESENFTNFHHGVAKTVAIITEFSNSLDHAIGGEIAENLDALYSFMVRELTLANLNKDMEKLQVVEKLLVDLRLTWGEAIEINKKEQGQLQPHIPASRMSVPASPSLNHQAPAGYVPFSISR